VPRDDEDHEVAPSRGVDVTSLEGTYRQNSGTTLSARATRALVALASVIGLLALANAVTAVAADGLSGLWRWLADAGFFLLVCAGGWLPALRPPFTRIQPTALTVRTSAFSTRTAPWDQVRAIRAQGRWDLEAHAVLADGSHLALPALPAQVVQQLGAAVARIHPDQTTSAPPAGLELPRNQDPGPPTRRSTRSPVEDIGMEGPFRRGPGRS